MLEIRNVTKTYRSKTGESVKALDNVSISFPESGMVFILGKSGSGKSTLLNAIGGLDSIDSGEFVIMGKSSKDFVGSDFDAYRNTFIGFIFQEYNVLDEFTVGANIALALELQGKKATEEKINHILAQVDLLSFAKRKPNELSGGQKQRVAIARALVKEPQIIMADEPTGALDSNTGKQIFDTLKELSKEKLVLIVSHDRDFAERYADRIVELADGHIISDVTKHEVEGKSLNDGIRQVSRHILQIKGGYRLTPEDVEMINNYLATSPEGVILSGDNRVNGELRSAAGITEDGGTTVFENTDMAKDVTVKEYDGRKTKFIRSRLPLKNAVKIGASGLKYKKFRLFMTILLSLVAFGMFGLADTMAAYNKITAATSSILDSHISNASFSLGVKVTYQYGDETSSYFSNAAMNDEDLKYLSEKTGLKFYPVYNGYDRATSGYGGIDVSGMMASNDYRCTAYEGKLYGFTALTAEDITAAGLSLVGRMPEADNEIVITEFLYRQFNIAGFDNKESGETVVKNQLTMTTDGAANSIIGKHLSLYSGGKYGADSSAASYVIVGVVDTHFDYERYAKFLPSNQNTMSPDGGGNNITDLLLQTELADTLAYGFHTLGFLTSARINTLAAAGMVQERTLGTYIALGSSGAMEDGAWLVSNAGDKPEYLRSFYRMGGSELLPLLNVSWFAGHSSLGTNEYLVHEDALESLYYNMSGKADTGLLDAKSAELFGEATFAEAKAKADAEGDQGYFNLLYRLANEAGLTEEELRAAYLPVLAEMFGFEIRESTSENAKSLLWNQLGYMSFSEKDETVSYDMIRNLYMNWYCYECITEKGLMSDAAFLSKMQEQLGEGFDKSDDTAKLDRLASAYYNYLMENEGYNAFDTVTYKDLKNSAGKTYAALLGVGEGDLFSMLSISVRAWNGGSMESVMEHEWKLVGTFDSDYNSDLIVSDTFTAEATAWMEANDMESGTQTRAEHEDGHWAFAIAAMPRDRATVEKLVRLSYDDTGDLNFGMQNQVMFTLDNFNSFIEIGAKVFLYIGIGFAVFSSLLLMNFISVSISYKKREIGILRAVGARSSDVFKIFFSESLIIALINYALAICAVLFTIFRINQWMYSEGIRVTLLTFGVRQLGLMLLISVVVAALASFLPVWRIARKKPVDAIKNR